MTDQLATFQRYAGPLRCPTRPAIRLTRPNGQAAPTNAPAPQSAERRPAM